MTKLVVGIDPGVKTGLAIWDCVGEKFGLIGTFNIIECFADLIPLVNGGLIDLLRFEDSRLRKGYYGDNANLKQQGAGSIKRDSSIWQEFCEYHKIKFEAVSPQSQKGLTKWDAKRFKHVTGWTARTSEHARDAALLVWGWK